MYWNLNVDKWENLAADGNNAECTYKMEGIILLQISKSLTSKLFIRK